MVRLPPSAPIDLQLHTIYSDGQWLPEELLAYLASQRFRVAAVTDHDTVEHVAEIQALGAARGVRMLAATEITTAWRGRPAHLLCYASEFTGGALASVAARIARDQLANTLAVHAALLSEGYTFPLTAEVARPADNARLLLAHGYAKSMADALEHIRAAGYIQVTAPLAEAVAAAHESGALAVLAHPGRGGGEIVRYDPAEIEDVLAEVPLDGIEVYYPLHTAAQTAAYETLARERGLLVSAGSDSHGPHQRYPIAYDARPCAALLARCGIEVTDMQEH